MTNRRPCWAPATKLDVEAGTNDAVDVTFVDPCGSTGSRSSLLVSRADMTTKLKRKNHKTSPVALALYISLTVNLIFSGVFSIPSNHRRRSEESFSENTYKEERQATAQLLQGSPSAADGVTGLASFTEILKASGSDKYYKHHYERYYSKWLERDFRKKRGVKVLEIGAERGRSLKAWQDYFTDPEIIVGLGFGKGSRIGFEVASNLTAVMVLHGDQSKPETMKALNEKGPWDVIIDDGSHVPQHVIYSLYKLWKSIKPGGMYIIEDLETSYWTKHKQVYGYPLKGTGIGSGPDGNAVTKLKQLIDVLNRHQIGARQLSVMPGDGDLCSIEWGMNIVALKKCSLAEAAANPPWFKLSYVKEGEIQQWIHESKLSNPK